jgi:hypothetical protein
MAKILFFILILTTASCAVHQSVIKEHVEIEMNTYEFEGAIQASAMPVLREESPLISYRRRFDYLLIAVPKMHLPSMAQKRKEFWDLYPDTVKLKKRYLKPFVQDEKLTHYFSLSIQAINQGHVCTGIAFTDEELMEVASKFLYCDKVLADTTIVSYVCVGLNGVSEAKWEKDFRLLEAFCYEAIFHDLNREESWIDASWTSKKNLACDKFKDSIRTLDGYLIDVRHELFGLMKEDPLLKSSLLTYYESTKSNLPFVINRTNE